jgi:hypothetical protein
MKVKLKEAFLNSKIYVPTVNDFMIGKFIPEKVQEKMSEKYPELFERITNPDENMIIEEEKEIEEPIKKKLEGDEEIN